ncbi:MAG: hypothetical protein KJ049_07940 [Gammaproteobacteria bacterium]|nr:hypothetical protein [Gammaproteobacteria bacterium]
MYKKSLALIPAATLALLTLAAAPVHAQTPPPGGSISITGTITATVTAVDQKDRWVTLKRADGSVVDIQVGPEAKNFPQIRVGDQVTAQHQETVDITVIPPGQAAPNVSAGSSLVTAPAGSKPLAVQVDTAVITGQVTAIDYDDRLVTLLGPLGNSRTLVVGPAARRFNEVKVGDNIQLTLKSSTMIEVTAPAKK